MSQITVPYYGVHFDEDGVAWILQGRGGTNAFGLKKQVPFTVSLASRNPHCNSSIPLAVPVPNDYHWTAFMKIYSDPLVQAMLPVPKTSTDTGLYFVANGDPELQLYIVSLTRLSSPIYPMTIPIWTRDAKKLLDDLNRSNIQTLVLTGVEAKHSSLLAQVAPLIVGGPGKVLLTGAPDVVLPPGAQRITTKVKEFDYRDLAALPLETLGAAIVRRYMRREWPIEPSGSYQHGRTTREVRQS